MKYNYLERYNLIDILNEAGIKVSSNLSKDIIYNKLKNYTKIELPSSDIDFSEIVRSIDGIFEDLSYYLDSIEKSIFDAKNLGDDANIEKLQKAYDDLFLYIYGKDKPETNIIQNFKKDNFVKNIYEKDILPKLENLENFPSLKKSTKIKTKFEELISNIELIPKLENEKKDLINKNFDLFKNGNGFFTSNDKTRGIILYWFFHEQKLYSLRLSSVKKIKDDENGVDFSFYVSNDFYDKSIDYFIENYAILSNFTLDKQTLNDSAGFWLKVGAIIKTFSDDYKINYFKFTGASHDLKEKPSKKTSQTATENSFEACKIYLKANLIQNENINELNSSLLELINSPLEENKNDLDKKLSQLNFNSEMKSLLSTLTSLQKINDNVNKNFKDICKKFKFNPPKDSEQKLKEDYEKYQQILLKRLEADNFFKKEIMIISSFIKILQDINIYKDNIKNNLINLNDALNKSKMQNKKFQQAIENIYSKYEEINIDYNIMISDFTKSNSLSLINLNKNIYKKLIDNKELSVKFYNLNNTIKKFIFLKTYKNEILLQIDRSNKNNKFLKASSWIKKIEAIFSNIIKKYQIYEDIYHTLLSLKNDMIKEIEDKNNYITWSKEEFEEKLTKTLEDISAREGTFVLHKDYSKRLKIYLNALDDSIFNMPERFFIKFINNLNFSPKLSYSSESEAIDGTMEIQPGWLLSFTDKGFFSLLNSRELKYYKILIEDLKMSKDDIFYYEGIVFKI